MDEDTGRLGGIDQQTTPDQSTRLLKEREPLNGILNL